MDLLHDESKPAAVDRGTAGGIDHDVISSCGSAKVRGRTLTATAAAAAGEDDNQHEHRQKREPSCAALLRHTNQDH